MDHFPTQLLLLYLVQVQPFFVFFFLLNHTGWRSAVLLPSYAVNTDLILSHISFAPKSKGKVQVIHPHNMTFILEHVKKEQHTRVKLTTPSIGIFFWNRHVPWIKAVSKARSTLAGVANRINLESIALFFVVDSKFVDMVPLKLIVCSSPDKCFPKSQESTKTLCMCTKKGSTLKLGWFFLGGTC